MIQNQYFKIFISLFLFWIMTLISEDITTALSYFFVLTLGIIHGSNDLSIINNFQNKNLSFRSMIVFYLVIILTAMIMLFFLEKLSFLLFIIFSSYHFGEQHFNNKIIPQKKLKRILNLNHGLFIFSLLFINKKIEVIKISEELFSLSLPLAFFEVFFFVSGLFYFSLLFYHWYINKDFKTTFEEILYLSFFYVLFKATSLIVGFSIYFLLWHSIPSILDQVKFLYNNTSLNSIKMYFKKSLLLWSVSILFILLVFVLLKDSFLFDSFIFGILFSISIPHIFVVSIMNTINSNKNTSRLSK